MPQSPLSAADPRADGESGFTLLELLVTSIIVLIVLGLVGQIFADSDRVYRTQRQYVDVRGNAGAALDMMVRLIRQAGETGAGVGIFPDPDGNGTLDSIRVVTDWNPRNGVVTDPYEDVTFTVAGGTLFKREPSDAGPVAFADRVQSIAFAYVSPAGVPVTNPITVPKAHLGYVTVTLQATPIANVAGRVFTASASVRRRE
jgi:prepilin-type N-terminal cleavage/methylation domain-containing protein